MGKCAKGHEFCIVCNKKWSDGHKCKDFSHSCCNIWDNRQCFRCPNCKVVVQAWSHNEIKPTTCGGCGHKICCICKEDFTITSAIEKHFDWPSPCQVGMMTKTQLVLMYIFLPFILIFYPFSWCCEDDYSRRHGYHGSHNHSLCGD